MKVYSRLIERVTDYNVDIPFDGKVDVKVKRGDSVRPGTVLFSQNYKRKVASYYLPRELKVTMKQADDYVVRIDGEFVTKGEVLAERLSTGGLAMRKIIASEDGILSLDRIDSGYLDILSEDIDDDFKFDGYGKVDSVELGRGMTISASVWGVKVMLNRKPRTQRGYKDFKVGLLSTIKDGDSVYAQQDLKGSYAGEIVYAGRFLYPELIDELYGRGASLVIGYSGDFADYVDNPKRVALIGGFGNISFVDEYAKLFRSMAGKLCYVDMGNEFIAWCDSGQYLRNTANEPSQSVISKLRPGMRVKILDQMKFGHLGKVVDVSEEGYVTLDLSDGEKILINQKSLQPVVL